MVGPQSRHQDLMGVPTPSLQAGHIWYLFYLNKSLGVLILASNMLIVGQQKPQREQA